MAFGHRSSPIRVGVRFLRRAVVIAASALQAACVTHEPLSDLYVGPEELPESVAERYDYAAADASNDDTALWRRRPRFTAHEVVLPASDGGEPIALEYYEHDEGDGPKPVVMVLPIYDGQPFVTRYFARYFAQRGWAAVAVGVDRERLRHMDGIEQAIRDTLVDYRRVLDWIVANPELDEQHIGVFGMSFGGIDAVMLAALDDRVDALVVGMAGGDLPYIAANTRYRPVHRAVDELLEESGQSRLAFERRLDAEIDTDPLLLAPYVDAERVLLVLARTDVIVPFESQQELRLSLGNPEALYLPTGHRTSVVYFPKLRSSAYEFFARQFGAAGADGVPN